MTCDKCSYLKELLEKQKTAIFAIYEGLFMVTEKGYKEYEIDTGQTRQRVSYQNIEDTKKMLEYLELNYERICTKYNNLCAGGGTGVTLVPSYTTWRTCKC